ncbi:hypothetical protein F2Q70_00041405 [Brassica cretica]|uniref:Uncharacterized protein n=1 Tax=Brassica cretica TaxID=69181 RepID=A0A8S9K874_BRACR|nr:hypothetical protein F2Q70_00041405 [Brassica cretica]
MKPISPIKFDPNIDLSETLADPISEKTRTVTLELATAATKDQKEDLTLNLLENALSPGSRIGRMVFAVLSLKKLVGS